MPKCPGIPTQSGCETDTVKNQQIKIIGKLEGTIRCFDTSHHPCQYFTCLPSPILAFYQSLSNNWVLFLYVQNKIWNECYSFQTGGYFTLHYTFALLWKKKKESFYNPGQNI